MELSEDYGSLGNLIAYLNGTRSINDRLEKSLDIFFVPLPIAVQHKEDVVISWLTDLLSSNKASQFTEEELINIWRCLTKIFTSKRVEALSKNKWVICLPTAFIDTLVAMASSVTIQNEIKESVFSICECFLHMPSISPQISLLMRHSMTLFVSLLGWVNERTPSTKLLVLLNKLFEKTTYDLKVNYSNVNAFIAIYEKLLYPVMLLVKRIKPNYDSQEANDLLINIEKFISSEVFSKEYYTYYETILSLPLRKDCKTDVSNEGASFFFFLVKCIETDAVETGTEILREFLTSFVRAYESFHFLLYKLVVNTMYLLGVTLEGGPAVEKNSVATLKISQTLLDDTSQRSYIASVLQVVLSCKLQITVTVAAVPLQNWLEKLGKHILKQNQISKGSFKCLTLILLISPTSILRIDGLISTIICCSKFTKFCYLAFDDLMCHILDIYFKMRSVDKLYMELSTSLLTVSEDEKSLCIPEPSFIYEERQLLPVKFMKHFLSTISSLGTHMILNIGETVVESLISCNRLLEKGYSKNNMCMATFNVWLSTRVLSAVSLHEVVAVSDMGQKVGEWMDKIALNGICPLVTHCNSTKKKSIPFHKVLLDFIFVWAEVHSSLLSTDTGYKRGTQFLQQDMLSVAPITDFSPQAPFLSKEEYDQLLTGLENDKASRFCVLQLVIQKVALLRAQRVEQKAKNTNTSYKHYYQLLTSCLDYIFETETTAANKDSVDLIAYHLPTLCPLLGKSHLLLAARLFVYGIQEEREAWLKFGNSYYFKKCVDMQSQIFTLVCGNIAAFLTGGKRKLETDRTGDNNEKDEKIKSKYLTHAILTNLSYISENKNAAKWKLKECYSLLELLLKSKKKYARLSSRSEKEILALLKVIDCFPLSLLKADAHKSVLALLLVMLIEEGGLCGRQTIVSDILVKLNILACSTPFLLVYHLCPKNPYFLLTWFIREAENYLGGSTIECTHLIRIFSKHLTISDATPVCLFGELVNLLRTFTESFFKCSSVDRQHILSYCEFLDVAGKEASSNEIYLVAAMMSLLQLRRVIETSSDSQMDSTVQKAAETLICWAVEMSKTVDLCKVTHVTISMCLTAFTLISVMQKKLGLIDAAAGSVKSQTGKPKKDVNRNNCETTAETMQLRNKKFSLKKIRAKGLQMTDLCISSENDMLIKTSLDYLVMLAAVANQRVREIWALLFKAWKALPADSDAHERLRPIMNEMCKTLNIKNFKILLESLMKEFQRDQKNPAMWLQWLTIVSIELTQGNFIQLKSSAAEQLIATVALQIHKIRLQDNERVPLIIISIFETVLTSKNNISTHAKSMILSFILNLQLKGTTFDTFTKVFPSLCSLLHTLLTVEFNLITTRGPVVLTAVSQLTLALIAQSDQKLDLSCEQIKELDSCCHCLEKVVKELRKYNFHLVKLVPFSLAVIVKGMQQTTMHPSVKAGIERISFQLFDISDTHCLRHLLVALPPSVTTLLKHLHRSYNDSFRYDPRETT